MARASASDMIPDDEASGAFIKETLTNKQKHLFSIDRTWLAEEAFFLNFVGSAGEEKMQSQMLAGLSTATSKNAPG